MTCPKCNNSNINMQVIEDKVKTKHSSLIVKIGRLFLILFTCGLWLLVPKKKETSKVKSKTVAVCQNCGYTWNVKN